MKLLQEGKHRKLHHVWIYILALLTTSLIFFPFANIPVWGRTTDQDATLAPVADTFVASGRPDTNWSEFRTIWVGYDQAGGYRVERSLLSFDASNIPAGSKIDTATLRLYLAATTPNNPPMSIGAYRIRGDWPENIAWSQHTSLPIDDTAVSTVSVGTAFTWYDWDVASALQAWVDARDTARFGLILKSADENPWQHERAFWSRNCSDNDCGVPPGLRPALLVRYQVSTPTPTGTPTWTPTVTPTPTPTSTPSPTPTPTGVWAAWREPQKLIMLPPAGQVDVLFDYNALEAANLVATLTGAAVFQESGTRQLEDTLQGSGSYSLTLTAKNDATPGDPFYLSLLVNGLTIRPDPRSGVIARMTYLPIILRDWRPPPTPTPTPTFTSTPSHTPTATSTSTATSTPSQTLTATRTGTATSTGSPAPTATGTPTVTPTPSQTPTPTATNTEPDTMHLGEFETSSRSEGLEASWEAQVKIWVHDFQHKPVEGAQVTGEWSGGVIATSGECTTNSSGACDIRKGNILPIIESVQFKVNDVAKKTLTYVPADNHAGDSVTVNRPTPPPPLR